MLEEHCMTGILYQRSSLQTFLYCHSEAALGCSVLLFSVWTAMATRWRSWRSLKASSVKGAPLSSSADDWTISFICIKREKIKKRKAAISQNTAARISAVSSKQCANISVSGVCQSRNERLVLIVLLFILYQRAKIIPGKSLICLLMRKLFLQMFIFDFFKTTSFNKIRPVLFECVHVMLFSKPKITTLWWTWEVVQPCIKINHQNGTIKGFSRHRLIGERLRI